MPAKTKQTKQTKKATLNRKISLSSNTGRFILFLLVFAVVGGGWMAYRSFAATYNNATFGGAQLKPSKTGDATMVNETTGSKRNTPVWQMTGGSGNKFLSLKNGVMLPTGARQVRSCAKVKLVSGSGQFALTHPNGQGNTETFTITATPDYQEFCTQYRVPITPMNQLRYADVGWGFGNKDTLRVGYISIQWK